MPWDEESMPHEAPGAQNASEGPSDEPERSSTHLDALLALDEIERRLTRYREALEDISTRPWLENALDPQWAALRARRALR